MYITEWLRVPILQGCVYVHFYKYVYMGVCVRERVFGDKIKLKYGEKSLKQVFVTYDLT